MGKLSLLSSPIKVNGYTVKNRIVVPPMADFGATNTDDFVNKRHLKHYGELSKGGAGLIIIEACSVCKTHEKRNTVGVFDDSCIPGLSTLAKSAKQNNAIVLVQLLNAGIDFLPYQTIEEIPLEMFIKYKQQFVDAAIRCKKAGFDGVELHAAHSLNLGSIWIHRAKEEFELPEYKELLKQLGVEGEWEGIGHCAIGYIDGLQPQAAKRKENRVYWAE